MAWFNVKYISFGTVREVQVQMHGLYDLNNKLVLLSPRVDSIDQIIEIERVASPSDVTPPVY